MPKSTFCNTAGLPDPEQLFLEQHAEHRRPDHIEPRLDAVHSPDRQQPPSPAAGLLEEVRVLQGLLSAEKVPRPARRIFLPRRDTLLLQRLLQARGRLGRLQEGRAAGRVRPARRLGQVSPQAQHQRQSDSPEHHRQVARRVLRHEDRHCQVSRGLVGSLFGGRGWILGGLPLNVCVFDVIRNSKSADN